MIINTTFKTVVTCWGGRELGTGRSTKRAFRITGLRFYFLSWEAYIDLDILINKRFEEFTVITVYMVYGTNEFKKIPPPQKMQNHVQHISIFLIR